MSSLLNFLDIHPIINSEIVLVEQKSLLYYVMKGNSKEIASLLNSGVTPDERDDAGRTPLMAAVFRNLTSIAEILIKAGADIEAQDKENYSVLYYAAVHGNFESTFLLYESGVNMDFNSAEFQSILEETKSNGYLHIVELLEAAAKKHWKF